MDDWFVLVNPAAGGYKVQRKFSSISKALTKAGIAFQFETSKSPSHAIEITERAVLNGFRNLIALGGDGTMNMLINGIFRQRNVATNRITIAIIPVGTGNDWIRTHQIPKSVEGAIEFIKRKKTVPHDVGHLAVRNGSAIRERYFINMAGIGFDGFVAERIEGVSSIIKIGTFAFVLGILDALFRYQHSNVTIRLDDQQIDQAIYNINAGICKYAGGGMKIAPNAIFNDGFFDVTVIKKIGKAEVIWNIPGLFNGTFVKNKKVTQYRTKNISVISVPQLPVECDGEVLGYGNVELKVLESAVNVVTGGKED